MLLLCSLGGFLFMPIQPALSLSTTLMFEEKMLRCWCCWYCCISKSDFVSCIENLKISGSVYSVLVAMSISKRLWESLSLQFTVLMLSCTRGVWHWGLLLELNFPYISFWLQIIKLSQALVAFCVVSAGLKLSVALQLMNCSVMQVDLFT